MITGATQMDGGILVCFLNKVNVVDDPELLELVKMECIVNLYYFS